MPSLAKVAFVHIGVPSSEVFHLPGSIKTQLRGIQHSVSFPLNPPPPQNGQPPVGMISPEMVGRSVGILLAKIFSRPR